MKRDQFLAGMVAAAAWGCAGTPDAEGSPEVSLDRTSDAYAYDEYGTYFRQAEAMSLYRTSAGDSWSYVSGNAFSADGALKFQGNAVGDFLVLQMNGHLAYSAHNFVIRVLTTRDSGQFQLWLGPTSEGPWTKEGEVFDAVLRGRQIFRVVDFGPVNTPGGTWAKFEVVGKNATSTGYSLTLDNFYWLD